MQKFCPVGDHRGCGLVERTIQSIKRRLGVMLLDENVTSIKLALSTIIRDLRWSKQKAIQCSPFKAHFDRLPKTEFKILRDSFSKNSDRLDKKHLERSALTATQLEKRIDQSRDNVKIVEKVEISLDVSPLFKTEVESARDRSRATALKTLLEANARWNEAKRDTSTNDLRRIVDKTSTINPDLRKKLLYSWQYGFIEDKPQEDALSGSPTLLGKDDNRKNGKAVTNPLKGKMQSESPHAVKTDAGAVYRKSDIAKAKIVISEPQEKTTKKVNESRSPHGDEPRTKSKKKEVEIQPESSDSDDLPESPERSHLKNVETPFQDSQ